MFLIYTAGPIRDRRGPYYVEQNVREAQAISVELLRMGWSVICPHTLSKNLDGIFHDGDETEKWLAADFEMLRRCDAIVMLPRWQESIGAKAELEFAKNLDIPVFFWANDYSLLRSIATNEEPFTKRV